MIDNKDELRPPEKISQNPEQVVPFKREQEKTFEKQESTIDDRIVSAELRREMEMLAADPTKEKDAEIQREKISYLGEKEKIEHLLQIAREKGLVFAIPVARKMGEPYLLDLLHDSLAREGFYQDFTK